MSSAKRPKQSWEEAKDGIAAARELLARYGLDQAHPDAYLVPNYELEKEWEEKLKDIK